MALRFVDSFSHYTQAFMPVKWDVCEFGSAETTMAQDLTSGRFGAGGVTFATTFNFTNAFIKAYMQKNYNGVSPVIVGLAVKQTGVQFQSGDVASNVNGGRLLTFMSGNSVQVRLTILQSGQIQASRNNNANEGLFPGVSDISKFTILGASTSAISASSFDFLEVKVTHHATTGIIEIKRNGAAFWTLSNVNTNIAGTGNSSAVVIGGGHWGTQSFQPLADSLKAVVSDVYVLDTAVDGSDALNPVDFIGDRHWEPLTPTADGFYTAWTPTGSADHFANVDEIPPNTTDYNATATLNAKDSFEVSAPAGPSTASALISLTMYCQKDTGGAFEIKGLMRLSGADRNGTAFQTPNPYAFRQSFLCSKPGGGAITLADINAGEMGYERTA